MVGRTVAVAVALGLLTAACTGGGKPRATTNPAASPSPSPSALRGGEAIFGAEAWPQCINPITACALNQWTFMTVLQHVLPRAMEVSPNGTFVASPLLEEPPTMANGGLTQSPFTVTYRIRGDAVWDDGSPVTSADFDFTWRALMSSSGSIWADQYRQIQAIDTTEPKRLVLRFVGPYAPWPELLGGSFGFIL